MMNLLNIESTDVVKVKKALNYAQNHVIGSGVYKMQREDMNLQSYSGLAFGLPCSGMSRRKLMNAFLVQNVPIRT